MGNKGQDEGKDQTCFLCLLVGLHITEWGGRGGSGISSAFARLDDFGNATLPRLVR